MDGAHHFRGLHDSAVRERYSRTGFQPTVGLVIVDAQGHGPIYIQVARAILFLETIPYRLHTVLDGAGLDAAMLRLEDETTREVLVQLDAFQGKGGRFFWGMQGKGIEEILEAFRTDEGHRVGVPQERKRAK
jgi:hypothetical protein